MDKHLEYYRLIGKNIAYYRTHLSHIEAENVNKAPSLEMLFNLCDALSIEPYQLFVEHE